MGVAKKTRKYAQVCNHIMAFKKIRSLTSFRKNQMKRAITKHDERLKNPPTSIPKEKPKGEDTRQATQAPTNLFFAANTSLGPPYHVLVDTNFVSHTIRAKLDLLPAMMDLCVSPLLVPAVEKKYHWLLTMSH